MSVALTGQMPVLDFFRGGAVPREIRLLTAQGAVSLRGVEQFALLVLLAHDSDTDIAASASGTLGGLSVSSMASMLVGGEVPPEVRHYIAARGLTEAVASMMSEPAAAPPVEESCDEQAAAAPVERRPIGTLPVAERFKLAVFGSREQRAQLVRDPNKLVALAVLSSPRLSESEVENIARMTGVVEEVLRAIGANRRWMRSYKVMCAIARNAKTPPGLAMHLIPHLHPRDIQMMAVDRNLPEVVRIAARKTIMRGSKKS